MDTYLDNLISSFFYTLLFLGAFLAAFVLVKAIPGLV